MDGRAHPTPGTCSVAQRRRVVRHVVADEAGDEVVAVVVARLAAQGQRVASGVYLVMAASPDGLRHCNTKVLVTR